MDRRKALQTIIATAGALAAGAAGAGDGEGVRSGVVPLPSDLPVAPPGPGHDSGHAAGAAGAFEYPRDGDLEWGGMMNRNFAKIAGAFEQLGVVTLHLHEELVQLRGQLDVAQEALDDLKCRREKGTPT